MIQQELCQSKIHYQFIADQLKQITKKKIKSFSKPQLDVALIIDYIFNKKNSLTYFALHKLFYLIEYKSVRKFGNRLTNSYIIRQKDGPYCTELHLFKLQKVLPYIKSKSLSKSNILLFKFSQGLFDVRLIDQYDMEDAVKELIDEVLKEHGNKSKCCIKTHSLFYATR